MPLSRQSYRKSLIAPLSLTILLGYATLAQAPSAHAETYMMAGKAISKDEYTAANLVKECLTNLDAGKLDVALSKAEEAKATAPNFYYVLGALGICYARLGRSDEAITNLRQALALQPNQPDMLWSLGATLQSAGKTQEALVVLKQFLVKYPQNPRAPQGKALVSLLENQMRMNNKITVHSDDDYFAEAIGLKTMRWADKDIPIKIFIASGDGVPGYQQAFGKVLQEALTAWEEASEGKIKFEQVTSPNLASITFKWSNNPNDVSNPAEGGEAKLIPYGNALRSVRLVVLTTKRMPGMLLNDQVIKFICIHELGHALGIAGHSQSPSDIMFSSLPLNFEQLKLSARDGKTLRKLYSTEITAAPDNSPTAKELVTMSDVATANEVVSINNKATAAMAAKDYSKAVEILKAGYAKYPESGALKRNLAAALNNTGLTALNAQQYDKALDIFQQALNLNPDNKPARGNIAIVHYNSGLTALKVAKLTEAESSLKLALQEFEASGNQTLLTKAANNYAVVLKKLGKDDEAKAIQDKYSVAGI